MRQIKTHIFGTLVVLALLSGCATTAKEEQSSLEELASTNVKQCRDGSPPACVTRMGKPVNCSCDAREELRHMLENRGADEEERRHGGG